MSENIIYQDNTITVTNKRIVLGSKTYPLRQVASVGMTRTSPDYGSVMGEGGCIGFLIGAGIGALFLTYIVTSLLGMNPGTTDYGGIIFSVFMGILVIVGLIMWNMKPSYNVQLGLSSGETNILSSEDRNYISKVVNKINEALVNIE
jgi:hypothetical protein